MKLDLFKNLPPEIINNILLRLSVRSIAVSKCVCKPWLHLLETDDFIKSHFSKSVPALALLMPARHSTRCTIFEFEDEDEVVLESHNLHYNPLIDFDFPFGESSMEGTAANSFLLIHTWLRTLYICNPLTRDYVELCFPQELTSAYRFSCGFGVSKISGQHKLVCINPVPESYSHYAYVYTLETGIWRHVQAGAALGYRFFRAFHAKFVNGNLHWTVLDSNNTIWICGFDLETECFRFFSYPLEEDVDEGYSIDNTLFVLSECLCVCCTTWDENIVIWLMKEYGVEKSWAKEYVIPIIPDFHTGRFVPVYPIKVFKDGDILMFWDDQLLIYYSNKTKMTQQVRMFDDAAAEKYGIYAMIFTPSLLSLKSFGMENVISF